MIWSVKKMGKKGKLKQFERDDSLTIHEKRVSDRQRIAEALGLGGNLLTDRQVKFLLERELSMQETGYIK